MRISRIEELQKIHLKIREVESSYSQKELENLEMGLMSAISKMLELNELARLEGLLILDEVAMAIDIDSPEEGLRHLLLLVVDGTEPKTLDDIGMARYYGGMYNDYNALKYFIYLEGALSIQACDNDRILEEKLKSMLPHKLYLKYIRDEDERRIEVETKKAQTLVKELCEAKKFWNPSENGYHISKLVDYTVCKLSDVNLQNVMRYVDNMVLALAMKGMGGEARKRIFDNLSVRLKKIVAEDVKYYDSVRQSDILDALTRLLAIIVSMIDDAEIVGDFEYLEPFMERPSSC